MSTLNKIILALLITTGVTMANSLPKYFTKTLDNKMQIVVIPMDNDSGVITTDIYYRVGSRNEIMGKSGIAHMLEHMSFKATKKYKAGEFDAIVKSHGGVNNASTGFDKTHYYIKTATKNLPMTLELFSELMHNLSLKDEEFQKERDVVAEERRWRTDNNPLGYLYFRIFNMQYTYHPYHWLPIGFMQDILSWNIADIREFYERYYQPSNAILIVSGDVKPERVYAEAQKYFGDIKNEHEIPQVKAVEPENDGSKRAILHKDNNRVDTLAIAYPIPNYEHEDQVALSAISELLSSGKSSRLEKSLVIEKQMVNMISAYNMELKDPGVFLIMALCNPGIGAEDVEREILSELDRLKSGDVTQEELDKLKINAKSDFIYSLEDSSSVASLFGEYLSKGNIEPLLEYEDKLDKLTVQEISEVAKRYFDSERSTTVFLKKQDINSTK
ncbi:Putative zinc protease [hydrothermal vent metagenome]|uniref:Putative zinc protease n=1 Tax=hydrothermal vent metagenome TaxID=652676 RepID=A0A1W1C905_9ZZZZ